MAQIGTFTRTADGFAGRLRTLALDVELTIVAGDIVGRRACARLSRPSR